MTDIKLDLPTHDLDLTTGDLVLIFDDDEIVQKLKIRLQFFLGEWFLDQRLGIPYFRDIFIKNPDLAVIRRIFRQTVLTTPGIADLDNFELSFDGTTRKLTVSFAATKVDGSVITFDDEEFIIDV